MGPKDAKVNPSYKEVCSGETGHVEVFYLEYEGGEFVYEELCKFLFRFTDPTTMNRSGNDIGTQYASVIYCYDKKQMKIANKVISEIQDMLSNGLITCYENKEIVTEIKEATVFYPAHEEHQLYLEKNPKGYCNHKLNRLEL
jgi:peptide-methionine (S)-S-oxide reductase